MIERLPELTATNGRRARASPVVGAGAEAHVVAFAAFDLDDVGAEQRELIGAVRPGEDAREVEDFYAAERFGTHWTAGLQARLFFFAAVMSGPGGPRSGLSVSHAGLCRCCRATASP